MWKETILSKILHNFHIFDYKTLAVLLIIIASYIIFKFSLRFFRESIEISNQIENLYTSYFILSIILVFLTSIVNILYLFLGFALSVIIFIFIFYTSKTKISRVYTKQNKIISNKNRVGWLYKEELFFFAIVSFFIILTIWAILYFSYH